MVQQIQRPDISECRLSTGDWSDDGTQGVDYEFMFGGLHQYCFIEMENEPVELDFMAYGLVNEGKLRAHPDLHKRVVPTEVVEWLTGRTYAHVEYDVDTCRRFTVTGSDDRVTSEGDFGGDGEAEVRSIVLETDGYIGDRERMTAFELVRSLAKGRVQAVEERSDAKNGGDDL